MRSRTIRFRKNTVIVEPDNKGRLSLSVNTLFRGYGSASMPRGAVEKLRDALQDWLESGDS